MAKNGYNQFFNKMGDMVDKRFVKSQENVRAFTIARTLDETLSDDKYIVKQTGRATVTVDEVPGKERYENNGTGVIDMKKWFARSPKRRDMKGGGWYMIIPIRRYTPNANQSDGSKMSKEEYNFVKANTSLTTSKSGSNVVDDYLYSNRDWDSPIPELSYKPRSKTLTRVANTNKDGSTRKTSNYYTFRTVSSKSPANSWLLNRQNVDPDNINSETQRIIDTVRNINNQL